MFSFDYSLNFILSSIDNAVFSNAFYLASWLFDTIPFTVLLLISSWLIYKKYGKKESLMFLSASILAILFSWSLKLYFDVPRPPSSRVFALGQSFPSTHAAVATAYFFSLLHFLRQTKDQRRRIIHILFCILCPMFVGVSRLYLGVHWFSDVLAGYIIGAFCVYISIHFFRKINLKM